MKSSEKEMMKFKEITLSPGNSPLIILPSPILTDNEHKQQNQGIQSSIISKNGITKELSGHDAESPGIKIVENDLKIDEENKLSWECHTRRYKLSYIDSLTGAMYHTKKKPLCGFILQAGTYQTFYFA